MEKKHPVECLRAYRFALNIWTHEERLRIFAVLEAKDAVKQRLMTNFKKCRLSTRDRDICFSSKK